MVLALESQCKEGSAPSIKSLVVDQERIRPSGDLSVAGVNTFSFLQCFDTVSWVTGL